MGCECTAHRYTTVRLGTHSTKRCTCKPGCRGFGPGSCNAPDPLVKAPVAPAWLTAFRPAITY